MSRYVADFETTTREEDCRVWAYAICEVGNTDNVIIGTTIDEFMEWCRSQKSNPTIWFHNLKFDSQFIFDWLFRHNFRHVEERQDRATGTFTTLISDMGQYYEVEVIFKLHNKNVKKVTFRDSLKLIPLSVDGIAKALHLPQQKGHIDYTAHDFLPVGAPLTPEEEEYIKGDVQIVAHAIDYFHSQGLNKMTIGACALAEYKKLVTKKYFNLWYPVPEYHDDVKQSYKGGFTYLNPKFESKTVGRGLVLDVNSLYPSTMRYELLPYGSPIFYKGKYVEDDLFPLYIQTIKCSFEIKKGKIPTIQLKNYLSFRGTEYLTSSNDEEVCLCLTSVDLKLFLDHYEVYNLVYMSGWKFRATHGLFDEYIDKWTENKKQAKEQGNHGLYTISKLLLNALYGKFGSSNKVKSKIPYLGEDGDVHYRTSDPEDKQPVYMPMASFITAHARNKTIRSAQMIQDRYYKGLSKAEFIYADTDSLHICLNGEDEEHFLETCGLDIHPTDLGAWDHEMVFKRGRYLRAKTYIEQEIITEEKYLKGIQGDTPKLFSKDKDGFYKLKVTVAGMPTGCHDQVTFRNFKLGAVYTGKKLPKLVRGGVILQDIDFSIKR